MRSAKMKLTLDPDLPRPHGWANPVVPGDHPDPTIIRVGGVYWASATSGEWAPQFPLFRSTDLVHWTPAGAIFPRQQPAWAEGSFWAPELVHDEMSGRFVCWYVARQRGGPLSIAVATAPSPAGPWTDHGPIVAQADGSIDPCFARNEDGKPYLLWKEDGNSAGRPTPIWAQALTDDLLHLIGEQIELIRNDEPWEEGVVEGPYVLRYVSESGKARFYLFYAGNSCCGKECKYVEGVARADKLLGPWEKLGHPLIGENDNWRCPGHGTAVRTSGSGGKPGQYYMLYHAYPASGTIYVGREAILDEITWGPDEADGHPSWPSVNEGTGPGEFQPAPPIDFQDDFRNAHVSDAWQWPVNTQPEVYSGHGTLRLAIPLASSLSPRPVESAMIAVPRPASLHYRATCALVLPAHPDGALWAGLAVIGDPFNTIGLGLRGGELTLWHRRGDTQATIWSEALTAWTEALSATGAVRLRATSVGDEHHLQFAFSRDGEQWVDAGPQYDASDLPAWDRGLRVGLLLEGPLGASADFHTFELRAQ